MRVGDHVLILDALGRLHPATIAPVPAGWRDRSRSDVRTERGDFPKSWVLIAGDRPSERMPWPVWDIFTDLEAAQTARDLRTASRKLRA